LPARRAEASVSQERIMPIFRLTLLSACLIMTWVGNACAQGYPNRLIRLVCAGLGGGADFLARQIAQELTPSAGRQIVVDNRANIIAVETVAKAPPDGYTLLINGNIMWTSPLLRSSTSYDTLRDFAPVTLATSTVNVLVVHPSLRVTSVRELIALAKARPGELNYGSGGTGSAIHLANALFTSMADINVAHVPFRSNAQIINNLIGGQIQMTIVSAGSVMEQVKAGRLKALAVSSAQPSALFPDLPTISAAGVPGYEAATIYAVFAPAKTPNDIVSWLNQHIVMVLTRPEEKDRFSAIGVDVIASSPEQLAAAIRSDVVRMSKVIKDAHITLDTD
jgi:tripartite-type tricarboxylate transporter receptor subunit TctC